jgi:hypothetical protein
MSSFFRELPLPFDESAGFTAPSAFGGYRVLHQIGSGVLGPVFRTYDPQRDRLVAVKAFRLDIIPEQVAKLADGLRRLAAAVPAHDGLVPALDAGLEGTTAYLASEYVAAETLDVAMRHLAPAPLDRALPILTQMAAAIDAAWAGGIGHGALHPRDVFVTVDSHDVRITGVGVVAAMESVGVRAPIRRPYTAPERVSGDSWDARADVYSLGAIAHELLTRRRPAGSGEQDGALTTDTTPEQRVQIRRVLSAALAEDPAHRFASAGAFTDALAAISRGEIPAAWPEAPDRPNTEIERDNQTPLPAEIAPAVAPAVVEPPPAAPPVIAAPPAVVVPPPVIAAPPPVELAHQAESVEFPLGVEALTAEPDAVAPEPLNLDLDVLGSAALPHVPVADPHPELRLIASDDVPPDVPVVARRSFPWSAVLAVAAAAIVVAITIGYGFRRHYDTNTAQVPPPASAPPTEVAPAPEPAVPPAVPSDATEVTVAPEPPAARAPARREGGEAAARPRVVRTAARVGQVVVRSTPSGALVVVDGRPRGQTPVTVSDLQLGEHTFEVARSGYVPHREVVILNASGASRTLSVRLPAGLPMAGGAPASADERSGSVFVDSRPQAARVFVDGRPAGTTPLRIGDVRAGTHVVRIERTGYSSFSTSVGVKAGEQARVTAALEER